MLDEPEPLAFQFHATYKSLVPLQQEANNLESLDLTNLSPEQLEQLAEKLSKLFNESEDTLSTLSEELKQIDIEDESDNS